MMNDEHDMEELLIIWLLGKKLRHVNQVIHNGEKVWVVSYYPRLWSPPIKFEHEDLKTALYMAVQYKLK